MIYVLLSIIIVLIVGLIVMVGTARHQIDDVRYQLAHAYAEVMSSLDVVIREVEVGEDVKPLRDIVVNLSDDVFELAKALDRFDDVVVTQLGDIERICEHVADAVDALGE